MDRLELGVQYGGLYDEVWDIGVDVTLPAVHGRTEVFSPDGNELGFLNRAACRSDPVRNPSELAGRFVSTPNTREQHLVGLANDTERKRQFDQHRLRFPHRSPVVQYLVDIVAPLRCGRGLSSFELIDLAHGGLRAFDACRKHRFLRRQGSEQNVWVRNRRENAVVARKRRNGRTD